MIKNLKNIRSSKGITQAKLAEAINTASYNVASWEQGRTEPDLDFLIALADYFNVSVDFLLGRPNIDISFSVEDQKKLDEDPQGIVFKDFKNLSDDDQKRLIDYLNLLIERQEFKSDK